MYKNRGIRENNNVLNPGGTPVQSDYRPERGGYSQYNQNSTSAVSSLIYGSANEA